MGRTSAVPHAAAPGHHGVNATASQEPTTANGNVAQGFMTANPAPVTSIIPNVAAQALHSASALLDAANADLQQLANLNGDIFGGGGSNDFSFDFSGVDFAAMDFGPMPGIGIFGGVNGAALMACPLS